MLRVVRSSSILDRECVRRGFRPSLEGLPDRCLLSVVSISSATQKSFDTVSIDYTIGSSNLSSLTMDVYRSSTSSETSPASDQVLIGQVTLSGSELTPGVHKNVPLVLGTRARASMRWRSTRSAHS